jgi:hypothetical protein
VASVTDPEAVIRHVLDHPIGITVGELADAKDALAALVAERDKLLNEGIHAAVSFTYIDGEAARIKARVALKNAAGWPLSDGEMERLAALAAGESE